jgi:hypothetical protein
MADSQRIVAWAKQTPTTRTPRPPPDAGVPRKIRSLRTMCEHRYEFVSRSLHLADESCSLPQLDNR